MPHRPGHVDNTCGTCSSMDRRQLIQKLAVGAVAAGATAAIFESCNPASDSTPKNPQWGYLSLYKPAMLTIKMAKEEEAKGEKDAGLKNGIIIPFFNSSDIPLSVGMVIGFHLRQIGSPPFFVIADNLTEHDHEEESGLEDRNIKMDECLKNLGYLKETPVPCDFFNKNQKE